MGDAELVQRPPGIEREARVGRHRRAGTKGDHEHAQAGDVVEAGRGGVDRVAVEAHQGAVDANALRQPVLADVHTLGQAGGAAGVEHEGEVIWARVELERPARPPEPGHQRQLAAGLGRDLVRRAGDICVGDDDRRVQSGDAGDELALGEAGPERRQGAAAAQRAGGESQRVRTTGADGGDDGAGRCAERVEPVGGRRAASPELLGRPGPRRMDHGWRRSIAAGQLGRESRRREPDQHSRGLRVATMPRGAIP